MCQHLFDYQLIALVRVSSTRQGENTTHMTDEGREREQDAGGGGKARYLNEAEGDRSITTRREWRYLLRGVRACVVSTIDFFSDTQ